MDRLRVLPPTISLAAHASGAAVLALVPLFLSDLPKAPAPPIDVIRLVGPSMDLRSAGSGGPVAVSRRPHLPKREGSLVLQGAVVRLVPPALDLADGFGVAGLLDDLPGWGGTPGFCLSGCTSGPGSGDGAGHGTIVDPKQPKREPIRVRGGDIRAPVKVVDVAPVYPPLAVASRVEGRVVLDCVIDESGRVTSVRVLQSKPLLDAAAVAAVQQWRYRPTLLNGVATSVLLEVTVEFKLR